MVDMARVHQSAGVATGRLGEIEAIDGASIFALTPEALMTYCRTQLKSLDEQVKATFDQQQFDQSELEALAALSEKVSGLSGDVHDQKFVDDLEAAIDRAVVQLHDTNPAVAEKLDEWKRSNLWRNTSGSGDPSFKDDMLGKDEIDKLTTILSDSKDAISKSAELNMVRLQSVMSQRQSALQICTNLVQSLGDTEKQIAANVGK